MCSYPVNIILKVRLVKLTTALYMSIYKATKSETIGSRLKKKASLMLLLFSSWICRRKTIYESRNLWFLCACNYIIWLRGVSHCQQEFTNSLAMLRNSYIIFMQKSHVAFCGDYSNGTTCLLLSCRETGWLNYLWPSLPLFSCFLNANIR